MTDSSSNQDHIHNLIASLCVSTPSQEIKAVLRKYEYGKTVKQIETNIIRSNKSDLEATLDFLKVTDHGTTKPQNSHNIVCKIQNLLPETCSVCQAKYCILLEDKPLLPCARCGQEVHRECFLKYIGIDDIDNENVINLYNPHSLPSIHYLCSECESDIIPSKSNKSKNSRSSKAQVINDDQKTNVIPINNPLPKANETTILIEDSSNQDNKTTNKNNQLDDEANKSETNEHAKFTKPGETTLPKSSEICSFFKKSICKHGLRGKGCKYTHPRLCLKFTQHGKNRSNGGCNRSDNCKFFHPKMCETSLKSYQCFDQNCIFKHIIGTQRVKTPNSNHQMFQHQNQNQNYQPPPLMNIQNQNTRIISPNSSNQMLEHQSQNHQPPPLMNISTQNQNSFLDLLHSMKEDIMKQIDIKLHTMKTMQTHQTNQPFKTLKQSSNQNVNYQPHLQFPSQSVQHLSSQVPQSSNTAAVHW